MVKGIDNALDHMELCFVFKKRRIILVKISLFFQEISFRTEFQGSNATYIFNSWQMGFSGGKFDTCYCQFRTLN